MMDKKCLDTEQIQLFIENELSLDESARIKEHLILCAKCHAAVEAVRLFDEKLQRQFDSAFSSSVITRKVMERVRELKSPDSVSKPSVSFFSFRWFSAFALALIIVLAVFTISNPTQFSSQVSIRFVGADSNATIDGVRAGTGYQFPLEPLKAVKPLSGNFLFELRLATDTTIFKVSGNVGVQLNSDYLIDFSGTHGDFVLAHVSGNSPLMFTVNSGKVKTLSPAQKLEFSLAPKTMQIDASSAEVAATETASVALVEEIEEEVATASAQMIGSDSAQVIDEKLPNLTDADASEQSNAKDMCPEAADPVKDRPNPFVDAPLGIGGAQ